MGARGKWSGDHEFQMYHVEFEVTLKHPRGCIQETSCDIGLDFFERVGSRNLYLEFISMWDLCNVGMNEVTFGDQYEGLNSFLELTISLLKQSRDPLSRKHLF